MATVSTQAVKDAFEGGITSCDLKFYIQDDSGNWVDFTDRAESKGRNQLVKMGSITYTAERLRGELQQKLSTVTLSNHDHFWDRPFPSDLYASLDSDFNSISGTAANFSTSIGGQVSALFRRKAAVRGLVFVGESMVPIAITIGVFLVDDLEFNPAASSVTVSFVPLSMPLIEADAGEIKDGEQWHRNRNASYLVRKILLQTYATTSGELPDGWEIDSYPFIRAPVDGSEAWTASHVGRPPERTFRYNGDSPEWLDPTAVCTAMCHWEWSQGTINITAGSNVITGNSTGWQKVSTDLHQKLMVGDAIIIAKEYTSGDGGSAYGNEGYYTITSIADEVGGNAPSLALDKELPGSQDETTIKYSIVRVYLGVGPSLYEYNIATDTYKELTTSPTQIGGTEYKYTIRRLWLNTADTEYPILGAALTERGYGADGRYAMQIFKFKWDDTTPTVTLWGDPLSDVELSEFIYRESENLDYTGVPEENLIGNWSMAAYANEPDQAAITLPFEQFVKDIREKTFSLFYHSDGSHDNGPTNNNTTNNDQLFLADSNRMLVPRGHFAAMSTNPNTLGSTLAYSIGQDGVLILNPDVGTKGAILFVKSTTPSIDQNDAVDTASAWSYDYHYIDMNQTPSGTPTVSSSIATSATIPLCATIDDVGNFYVSHYRVRLHGTDTNDSTIYRINGTTWAFTPIYTNLGLTVSTHYRPIIDLFFCRDASADPLLWCSQLRLDLIDTYALLVHADPLLTGSAQTSMIFKEAYRDDRSRGFCRWNIGTDASPDYQVLFHGADTGLIRRLDCDDSADTPDGTIMSQIPATELDGQMTGSMINLSSVKEILWITSPDQARNGRQEGMHYLAKFSFMMPTRVELADFEGMNSWEAIRELAGVANAVFGFNPDATFFFRERPRHQGASYTFTNVGQTKKVFSISKGLGQKEIINVSSKTPGKVSMGEIDVNIRLQPGSEYAKNDAEKHSFDAFQRGFLGKRSIVLTCIQGGKIRTSGSTRTDRAAFKFRVLEGDIKTTVGSAYTAGQSINISNPIGLRFGSILRVEGTDSNGDEVSDEAFVGHRLEYSAGGYLQVKSAVSDEDEFIPIKTSSGASGSGYTLTDELDGINRSLRQGDVLLIGDIGDGSNWEYVTVQSIDANFSEDSAQGRVFITRSTDLLNTPSSHSASEDIYIIRNGADIVLSQSLSDPFAKGSDVTVEFPTKDTLSLSYRVDPSDITSAYLGSGLFYPVENEFVQIGGDNTPYSTGIFLQLSLPDGDSSTNLKFTIDDSIRIDCPGLLLEEDSSMVQSHIDQSSVKKWGRRESQRPLCKFQNLMQARWAARREVRDNKDPKYTVKINSILAPWITMTDIVNVQDPDVFPKSKQFTETCYISSLSFDLQSSSKMNLLLRGVNSY